MYKVLNNLVLELKQEALFNKAITKSLRRHHLKLQKDLSGLVLLTAAFSLKVVSTLNKLPVEGVAARPVDVFKGDSTVDAEC